MKICINYSLLFIVIIVAACKENPTEQPFELNALLTEEMVNNVSLDQGVRVDSINLNGGIIWDYAISVPDINTDVEVPFIIGLHGGPLGSSNGEGYLTCLADPGFKNLNAIIFSPDAGEYYFWDENNYSLILTLIEYAKKYWPIDPDKIIVSGYSNGGIGSWFLGTNYPKVFSAAIPVASNYDYSSKLKIPFFVIHGDYDKTFPITDMQKLVNSLKNNGSDIRLFVMEGYGHDTGCDYDYSLVQASDWLLNEVWN